MIRLGTRGSALALAQARLVAALLPGDVELVTIKTTGDAGKGAGTDKARFVKQIEDSLLEERIDLAVHSAKDVPGELPKGLAIVGVPERADPRDSLCGFASIDDLPEGGVVGTASLRRRSQLLALRPDLDVREVRGNVDTRLGKLEAGEYDALLLAAAGLARLGRGSHGTPIDGATMTPAPGQGCLALEAREDDDQARAQAALITDETALIELTAERAAVVALGATCDTPVGAWAQAGEHLVLEVFAGAADGSAWIRDQAVGERAEASQLGRRVAARMDAAGAQDVLATDA